MTDALRIRPEEHLDHAAIRTIVEAAFKGSAEADLIEQLRSDHDLVLSLLAVDEKPVGHLACSPLHLPEGSNVKACALAPLAVLPQQQNAGIGTALVHEAVRQLRDAGYDLILVLGEPAYYGRFGFSAEMARALKTPYDGPYLQALHLSAKGPEIRGPVAYARAFAGLS